MELDMRDFITPQWLEEVRIDLVTARCTTFMDRAFPSLLGATEAMHREVRKAEAHVPCPSCKI